MCNTDIIGSEDVAKKDELTNVGSSNLFSLFTKRFSVSDDALNVQCDRNRINKTSSDEKLKDKPTSDQRKKLLVAALLLEPETDAKSKQNVQKSGIRNITIASPKLKKKSFTKSKKSVKKKNSFKGNKKVSSTNSDDVLIAENQVKITASLKRIPGRPSLAKKKSVVCPAPPNCSKIVSFVHDECPEVLGEEEDEENATSASEDEEEHKDGTISFKTISHTVKTLVNSRNKKESG